MSSVESYGDGDYRVDWSPCTHDYILHDAMTKEWIVWKCWKCGAKKMKEIKEIDDDTHESD